MPLRALTRGALRLPVLVHRIGAGALLGPRVVLLDHVGRRSGRVHRTPVEVVDRPGDGEVVVVAGLGERADWVRNVRARPELRVHEGGGPPRTLRAEVLDASASRAWLAEVRRDRPVSFAVVSVVLGAMALGLLGSTSTDPVVVRLVEPAPALGGGR